MLEKIISSKVKRELLEFFIKNPNKIFYQSQIKFNLKSTNSWAAIQKELKDLVELEIIKTWTDKIHRYYRAESDTKSFKTIMDLTQTFTKKR